MPQTDNVLHNADCDQQQNYGDLNVNIFLGDTQQICYTVAQITDHLVQGSLHIEAEKQEYDLTCDHHNFADLVRNKELDRFDGNVLPVSNC